MTIINRQSIRAHMAERDRYDDFIVKFAEGLAKELPGGGIPEKYTYESWDLWDEKVSVKFEHSWQGGCDTIYIEFPLSIIDDSERRADFIRQKWAEYEAKAEETRERERARDVAELARLQEKLGVA